MTDQTQATQEARARVTQADIVDAFDLDQHYGPREIEALFQAFDRHRETHDASSGGWIVGNNAGQWRTFDSFGWAWTDRRDLAVRYARREDAELVHGDDEDSWRVEQFSTSEAATADVLDHARIEAIVERAVQRILNGFSFETLSTVENLRARLAMCARQAVHDARAALKETSHG